MSANFGNDDLLARRVPLAGTFNVRDVGGYPASDGRTVKWRTVLRGDAFDRVDDEGRALLEELGIRTSIDLREPYERTLAPDLLHKTVRHVANPLFSDAAPVSSEGSERATLSTLQEIYRLLIQSRGVALVEAIRELTQPGALPAIVHCTGGKDRTGVLIALVLSAIGVPDEVVAIDYAATSLFLGEEFRSMLLARSDAPVDDERFVRVLACEPELILGVLEEIRNEYGDIGSYLVHHGLSTTELDALCDLLLEEPDRPAR